VIATASGFFLSSRRRHTRSKRDWSSDVCSSDLELGTGFVPFSPLGKGFLTGTVSTSAEFADGDIRSTIPRFTADNLDANQALVQIGRASCRESGEAAGREERGHKKRQRRRKARS